MKNVLVVGNWKSNKTNAEAKDWLAKFSGTYHNVVLCVPFTLLPIIKGPFQLGAQDVSPFDEGAYTGEVSARQIKEFADWVIIGHSERRKLFGESDDVLARKVTLAKSAGLKVIYCVPDAGTGVPMGVDVVAYEPVWAIGTGKTDSPQGAGQVITDIKAKTQVGSVIYGGSVTPDNVASFVREPAIDGVLPGGASLDPIKFSDLITNAQT